MHFQKAWEKDIHTSNQKYYTFSQEGLSIHKQRDSFQVWVNQ